MDTDDNGADTSVPWKEDDAVEGDVLEQGTGRLTTAESMAALGIEPQIVTNVNHMLATVLAENIVVINNSSITDQLIIPHTGLYREGVFDYTPVGLGEKSLDLELLYLLTRVDSTTGAIVWCLITNYKEGPTSSTLTDLIAAGWNMLAVKDYNVFELERIEDKAGYFRKASVEPDPS